MPPVNASDLLLALDGPAAGGSTWFQNAVLIVASLAIGFFIFVRPAQQERKEKDDLMSSLSKDDRVVTASGMRGRITMVSEETVMLDMGNKVLIEFEKSAIARRLDDAQA